MSSARRRGHNLREGGSQEGKQVDGRRGGVEDCGGFGLGDGVLITLYWSILGREKETNHYSHWQIQRVWKGWFSTC